MADTLRFEGFELHPGERQLDVAGQPARLGARAFDLLIALVERRDRVVDKHELLDLVWPKLVVEEGNLQVHVHALRKLLGPGAITTVPGRGYRFTARPAYSGAVPPRSGTARPSGARGAQGPAVTGDFAAGNLPAFLPELYGRAGDVQAICALLHTERLVTISGAGGIGKTRLAQSVAHEVRGRYADGTWMVELAWVHDEGQLVAHIAQAMGLTLSGSQPGIEQLTETLGSRELLLVMDNCEHLLDAVGALALRLLQGAPSVRSLVTSQELLRVGGEQVYRLAPLAVPVSRHLQTALDYGAVRLFVERARALDRRFELDATNVDAVVDICSALDGIALAIELAAARVPMLGVFGILDRLSERLRVLTGGSRVSLRRHQTLRAALDWSHSLLDDDEKKVFRRLGLFSGGFFVEGAQAVGGDEQLDEWAVLDLLSALVDKSLVMVEGDAPPRYRLLETSRAYAMERLAEAGETDAWMRRHAQATLSLCERAVRERDSEWIWSEMNNIRAAYDWAIGSGGDDLIAVSLACLPAMVMSVRGLVAESLNRLLQVEPLVQGDLPPSLAAQYWQWLGRIGIEGRLPTSRCIDALRRAESMFRSQGNLRHVHACLRMQAEAMVSQDDLAGAAQALRCAESQESATTPVADRLRRMRVHGLLHAAAGRHEESLTAFGLAHGMARAAGIARYELILMADMAHVYLRMGRALQATEQFRSLCETAQRTGSQGLTLAHAQAGLTAALLMQPQVAQATEVAIGAVGLLRRCGLLVAYCDLYAWLMACRGQAQVAAQLIGASDEFHRYSETSRNAVKRHARQEALRLLQEQLPPDALQPWLSQGAASGEDTVARLLERTVSSLDAQPAHRLPPGVTDSP